MKKLVFLLLLFSSTAQAQWIKGFNFSDTTTACGVNDTYLRPQGGGGTSDNYPTTRNTVTFGSTLDIGDNRRDRGGAVNCKLQGISFNENNAANQGTIRVDVPASGQYKVRLAMGEGNGFAAGANQKALFVDSDTTTVLATITAASVSADHWIDATGVDRTEATWLASNAQLTVTLTGTSFYLKYGYGDGSTSGNTFIAYLELEQVMAPTPTPTPTAAPSTCSKGQVCSLCKKGQCGGNDLL